MLLHSNHVRPSFVIYTARVRRARVAAVARIREEDGLRDNDNVSPWEHALAHLSLCLYFAEEHNRAYVVAMWRRLNREYANQADR
jgi:hypothetical protein